jgi:hypothetical protein
MVDMSFFLVKPMQNSLDFLLSPVWISSFLQFRFPHFFSFDFLISAVWISSFLQFGFPHFSSLDFLISPVWISSPYICRQAPATPPVLDEAKPGLDCKSK